MIPLFTDRELEEKKPMEKLKFKCIVCDKIFEIEKRQYTYFLRKKTTHTFEFCSKKCKGSVESKSVKLKCCNCNKDIIKKQKEIKKSKSGNHFCSKSCAATYNNKHKITGNRRSKLELFLEEQLISLCPDLEILFNNKEIINSELDIYIPSLKLAFELNGIFHYEPIYGQDKLGQIQNNDNRKFQACLEKGIELCIIDTSVQKNFKKEKSIKFLNIILQIISNKK